MSLLPDNDRILLGPGPSLTSSRVMRAMASPTISHLDPIMIRLLDDVRERLLRTFQAADGSFAFAVSGTGTSGMETCVANLVQPGTRATVVVTGYFGDRLAQMCDVRAIRKRCVRACKPRMPTSSRWCTRKLRPVCEIRSPSWRRLRVRSER